MYIVLKGITNDNIAREIAFYNGLSNQKTIWKLIQF